MKVFLVLPAYNEEVSLARLLERLERLSPEPPLHVLVVNDGSQDGTAGVADRFAARLALERFDHPHNLGLGAALETGLGSALERAGPDDIVITMDADDTHPPSLIPGLTLAIRAGADVVVASRYAPGGRVAGLGALRRLMSRGAAALARLVVPVAGVRDFTSGYRAYRSEVLGRVRERYGGFVSERGFAATLELLTRLSACGASFAEVPLDLAYDRKRGPSKMRVLRTVRATLGVLWRARLSRPRATARR